MTIIKNILAFIILILLINVTQIILYPLNKKMEQAGLQLRAKIINYCKHKENSN